MEAKLTFNTKIGGVADMEASRYALADIQLIPRNGGAWAIATDGRILAVTPVEGTCDAACRLPAAALDARKVPATKDVQLVGGKWQLPASHDSMTPTEGRWPNAAKIIADAQADGRIAVTLDPRLLVKIYHALVDEDEFDRGVTMLIDPTVPDQMVLIVAGDGLAAIMPVATEKKPEDWTSRRDEFVADWTKAMPGEPVQSSPKKRTAKKKAAKRKNRKAART